MAPGGQAHRSADGEKKLNAACIDLSTNGFLLKLAAYCRFFV